MKRNMHGRWEIDPDLGEQLEPHEPAIAQKISALIARGICEQFSATGPPARRAVHARAHGCVEAEFRVEESLPAHLAQGIFQPGAVYRAWIRFSNASADVRRSDVKRDVRAMAIKLLGVRCEPDSGEAHPAATQDFILLNSPVFFAHGAGAYLRFTKLQASRNPVLRWCAPLALGLKGALIGLRMQSSRIGNPLAVRYWSTVPFQLGDVPFKQAVKLTAVPHTPAAAIPRRAGPRFLREAMIAQLGGGAAVFDFLVQPRTSSDMSVEDARVEWKEAAAPFCKVATITIPRQDFATPERDALAENLAFNPWHTSRLHRPLGGVNRGRRVVYETISELRRHFNEVSLREPRAEDPSSQLPPLPS